MACVNLGTANGFNLFLFGNHTQSFVDSEGRVAVGGNATYNSYGIGDKLPVSTTRSDLIVRGNINITGGTNFAGNTTIFPNGTVINYSMTNNNGVPGQPLVGTPVDFDGAEQSLAQLSLNLAGLPVNGTVVNNFGTIFLFGTDPALNIFMFNGNNVDGNGLRLDTANGINIISPAGSTILINVGDDNVGFGSYQIFRNGVTPNPSEGQFILWNLYQATTAYNQNLSILGSVLAPYANWEAIGFGNIDGTLVAQSLTNVGGTLEAHNVPFMGCLPDVNPPTTSTTTTSTTSSTTSTTTASTTASTTSTTSTASTTSTSSSSSTSSTSSTTTAIPTTSTTTTTTTSTTPVPTTTTSTSTTTPAIVTGPIITATKTPNVTTAQIGDTITYTITVTNIGTAPGEAVIVEALPPGVHFIPSSLLIDGGFFSGVDITEQVVIGIINVGQVVTIQFQAFVTGYPPNGLITNTGFVVTVPPGTVPATCTPGDISVNALPGVTPVPGLFLPVLPVFKPGVTPTPGQVPNLGPITGPDGSVLLNQQISVPGITLPPLVGVTIPVLTGSIQPIVSTSFVTVPWTTVMNAPNLHISKTFLALTLFVGQRITYTIFVVNNGNAVSGRTVLTDILPSNAVFIPGTIRVNNVLRLDDNPNEGISLGPIAQNESILVRFDILVRGSGSLTNTAQVKADFLLPNQQLLSQTFASNTISNPVSMIRASDYASFLKTADAQIVKAGESYHYNIMLTNLSTDIIATNVIFYDPLDNQLQYISGSLTVDGIPQPDPQAGIPLGTIAPGVTRRLTFQVNVLAEPMGGIVLNQAAVLFEFRYGASCFRAGLLTNTVRVIVEEEEE